MTSRLDELLAIARTRPLTERERAEVDPESAAGVDPLLLAESLAGGAQLLTPQEADRMFRARAPEVAPALQVVVFRDGNLVGSESFAAGDYALGSDPACELVLPDDAIGRCQAFLVFRDGKVTLQNVAADVAMVVNGGAQKTADVQALDDIRFGPFLLKFRVVGPRKAPVQRAPTPRPSPRVEAPVPPQARPQPAPQPPRAETPVPQARPQPPQPPAPQPTQPKPAAPPRRPTPQPQPQAAAQPEPTRPKSRAARLKGLTFPASADEKAALAAPEQGKDTGPYLRVRVFWGRTTVGIFGFAPGSEVFAGPGETKGVPLFRLGLPSDRFLLAKSEQGRWYARVPRGQRAFRFEPQGWRPVEGTPDGDASRVPLEPGSMLRLGDAQYSVELRVERTRLAPNESLKTLVRSGAVLPFGIVAGLGLALTAAVVFMPDYSRDAADFNPQQMLHAAKAILKPPEKKKEEKKREEKKVVEKAEKPSKKTDLPPDVPKTKVAQVNSAMKAVQKVMNAGPAVESLLKATSKLAGGPKGYGDKGMGYKLSPLIGKPPIAMAGMGFGPGMGGFGTQTVGMGAIRGMGGGGGGGIGTFSAGGTGKGKVAGTVVSAPKSGFKQRAGGGMLARELIAKVINEHLGEVRGCYERALLKEAGLAGKLVLEWTIDTNGRVEEIKVKQATIRGAEVPNCIVGSLKGWVFPKPTGGKVVVSYPFLFNSVGF